MGAKAGGPTRREYAKTKPPLDRQKTEAFISNAPLITIIVFPGRGGVPKLGHVCDFFLTFGQIVGKLSYERRLTNLALKNGE